MSLRDILTAEGLSEDQIARIEAQAREDALSLSPAGEAFAAAHPNESVVSEIIWPAGESDGIGRPI